MAAREPQKLTKILGSSIVEKRRLLGMTQAELAERLNMAPDALSRIENGFVAPRFGRIEEIAEIFNCSVAELFREKKESIKEKSESIADIIRPLSSEKQEELIQLLGHLVIILRK